VDAAWGPSKFGLSPGGPPNPAHSELTSLHTPAEGGNAAHAVLSLENPLLAVALIAAVTLGAAAFSTSVRVGSAKAAISLGKQ
jgi:hypothetical protein